MGDLGVTYDDHLRLVGKRVRDFLLVLIELFSLGRTAEALGAITGSKSAISLLRDGKFTEVHVCHNLVTDEVLTKLLQK